MVDGIDLAAVDADAYNAAELQRLEDEVERLERDLEELEAQLEAHDKQLDAFEPAGSGSGGRSGVHIDRLFGT